MTPDTDMEEPVKKSRIFIFLGPPAFLLAFSHSLTGAALTDLIVYRTCLVTLNINATDCLMLRKNAGSPAAMDLEAKVEPYASVILMVQNLIDNILPGLVALYAGPWSDRGGRRPLLLAAYSGFVFKYVILSIVCNWNISPWYLLFSIIPTDIMGSLTVVKIALFCYAADKASEENKRRQLILLEVSIIAGGVLGPLTGRLIYENYGYMAVFVTGAICCTSALAYIYFRIPESVENTSKKSIHGNYKFSFMNELGTNSSAQQKTFHRTVIYLAMFTLGVNTLLIKGHTTIEFLFTRARLGWDLERYSELVAATSAIHSTGLCIVSLRGRISGVSDTLITGLALISALGSAITRALAWQSWHMYLAVCIETFAATVAPVVRSLISKFVPAQDVGKVFALASFLELLGSLAVTPLFTSIYSHYLPPIYPSPVYLLPISLYTLLIVCVSCMEMLIRKSRKPPTYISAAQEDL